VTILLFLHRQPVLISISHPVTKRVILSLQWPLLQIRQSVSCSLVGSPAVYLSKPKAYPQYFAMTIMPFGNFNVIMANLIYSQHESPVCLGGHSTDPNEQNTQQSPGFGFNISSHFGHW
jgi:hypothetical protein